MVHLHHSGALKSITIPITYVPQYVEYAKVERFVDAYYVCIKDMYALGSGSPKIEGAKGPCSGPLSLVRLFPLQFEIYSPVKTVQKVSLPPWFRGSTPVF